jgi:poly(A) polymerase
MPSKFEQATAIVRRLRQAGYTALLAGGCVRDRLLGREPKDYDVATDAPPAAVQEIFSQTVPVGVQFGVVLVIEDGHPFEVATFRSDGAYVDGRRPQSVHFSTPEADARRRDFTINALFLDPVDQRIVDHVGGRADLDRKVLRAIDNPDDRFREDRLRLIRAVRFAATLDFEIEPATYAAIRAHAPAILEVAWERIGGELVQMLTGGRAERGLQLLDATGLLPHVLPEVEALRGVAQSPDYHPEGDVLVHTALVLKFLPPACAETLALGALLHDVAKPACAAERDGRITFYGHCEQGAEMAKAVCQRLRRSRDVWERVGYLVHNHLRLVQAPEMRLSTLKRMLREEGFPELLQLARCDALASNGDLQYVEFCEAKLSELGEEAMCPEALLRGRDLLAMGYQAGPLFKTILDAVEAAQLEGELTSPEEARAWVQRNYAQD